LFIAGKRHEALRTAEEALEGSQTLISPSFAGPYARWLSAVGAGERKEGAKALIEELIVGLERFDALDKAEILCAKLKLDEDDFGVHTASRANLHSKLLNLPPAVRSQLAALEMLPGR
jgi:hypothetical protein